MQKRKNIARDISWLSFNSRVLQEAEDDSVPLKERIRFLGIYSNNMDEFFRVRVAALQRMIELGSKSRMHLEIDPVHILEDIQKKVLVMQKTFDKVWNDLQKELAKENIFLLNEKKLNYRQQKFALEYFNEQVRSYIVPLMIESIPTFPQINDKSLYLACQLSKHDGSLPMKLALVSIPTKHISRFLILPSTGNKTEIILLEDIVRLALPGIFSFFGYDTFASHVIKLTRDAEIDIDSDVSTSLMQKIERGVKNRKRGKPVRFVYDKEIPTHVLSYLIHKLGLTRKDHLIPGSRIHNFKDFMDFPDVIPSATTRKKPFIHPALNFSPSVSGVILQRDVLLNFPFHSFDSIVDMLREAAIDPQVTCIKISCYRLAPRSRIINALTNACRNGKQVTVMLELRARFDEEANLEWKKDLEDAGVKVLIGIPNMKVHAKICLIKKRVNNHTTHYGFVGTGNLNEKTATVYGDHFLLTSNRKIMADVNRIFNFLENPKSRLNPLKECRTLLISPTGMRNVLSAFITREIKNAQRKKPAGIILKLNSLSDEKLIEKLYEAAKAGVEIKLIVRGIFCMFTEQKKFAKSVQAISIVDEYLEHARVLIFHNNGNQVVYLSSADWMVRNLDHRVEAAVPVLESNIKKELIDILNLQLQDNIKARILDNELSNQYVNPRNKAKIRSQVEIYKYLVRKWPG